MLEIPDFDNWYRDNPDPFGVRTRWYERRKLAILLASLRSERYRAAWDPACGTGELLLALADRCGSVLGTEISSNAVRIARDVTARRVNVDVGLLELPHAPPTTTSFDLVVLSEVLYYLPEAARAESVTLIDSVMCGPGPREVVSVHWRHHPHDAYLSGARVTDELDVLLGRRGWSQGVRHDDTDFVLAAWTRGVQGSGTDELG